MRWLVSGRARAVTALAAIVTAIAAALAMAPSAQGSFNGDLGVALDSTTGDVYVSDFGNNRVEKFTSGGGYLAELGSVGTGVAQFEGPWGLAVDPSTGHTYIVDSGNNRVENWGNP